MKKLISAFCVLFLTLSAVCAKPAPIPEWMVDKNGPYPFARYISEVGRGKTEIEARADALKNISMFFESNVQTEIVAEKNYVSTDEKQSSKRSLVSTSIIKSDVGLIGVEYTEPYYEKSKKTYNVLAFIDRKKAFDLFDPEIVASKNKFRGFVDAAQTYLDEEEDTIEAYRLYQKAIEHSEQYLTNIMFGHILYAEGVKKYSADEKLIGNLEAICAQMVTETKIYVDVENDYGGIVKTAVENELKKAGYTIVSSKGKANFYVKSNIEDNMEKSKVDGEEIFSYYPEYFMEISSMTKGKYSFHIKLGKYSGFSQLAAQKKAYNGVAKKIEDELYADVLANLLK